jgi:hypothetical protein
LKRSVVDLATGDKTGLTESLRIVRFIQQRYDCPESFNSIKGHKNLQNTIPHINHLNESHMSQGTLKKPVKASLVQ